MTGGQFLQGGQRVGDLRATVRPLLPEGFRYGRVVHDGCRSPGFQRVFRIAVTVETLAVQGEDESGTMCRLSVEIRGNAGGKVRIVPCRV